MESCVILCGGKGTRCGNITNYIPKEMLPINGEPALKYVLDEVINADIKNLIIVINPNKEIIKKYVLDYFKEVKQNININFVIQEVANGTGGAIKLCEKHINDEFFALLYADDIFEDVTNLKQMIGTHLKTNKTVLGVLNVSEERVGLYGMVVSDNENKVIDLIEKPTIDLITSQTVSIGRYIINTEILNLLNNNDGSQEIMLTDGLNNLIKKDEVVAHHISSKRFDIGNPIGLLEANEYYCRRK